MSKDYKLKELLTIKNGKDYRTLKKGNIPVYGSSGIISYVDKYLFDDESILLPRKGTLDNICYVDKPFWTVDTMYWSVINKDIVYPKYLYCYLSLLNLSCLDSGSALPSMTFNSYYMLKIKLPTLNIQKKIGDVCFSIIDKIKLNNKINTELEAMAKTIYDYWFLQFEFPNEEGKPYKSSGGKMVYNQELKREIPEGWEVKKLGYILDKVPYTIKIKNKDYLPKGKYPIIDQSIKFICGYTNNNELLLNVKEAIIFGDHTKYVKYINFNFARGADGTQILLSKNKNLSNIDLYYQIKNMDLVSQGYSRYFKFLKEKEIVIPNNNISIKFNDLVEPLYTQIKNNIFENQELISLRDFLLPLLMNGQVGFNDSEEK